MSFAEKLERLARLVPGVRGYQDKEASRESDRSVRGRLVEELEEQKRELEEDKRRLVEARRLGPLPALDRLASKLDHLANTIRYAPRGYRGFFDANQHIQKSLDDLYDFDLSLFAELAKLRAFVTGIREAGNDETLLRSAGELLSQALDEVETIYRSRQALLS